MATAEEKNVEQEVENKAEEEEAMEDGKAHKALFDQPLIQEGKRKRKSTDVFSYSNTGKVRRESLGDGSGGSGIKLKDSPFIDYQISKHKPDELKPLHKLCFERPGTKAEIRRNLRMFNGWDFSKDSDLYKKKISYMEKLEMSVLDLICKVLDIEPLEETDATVECLAEFFMCPKDSGKSVPPSPVKRRKSSSGRPSKKSKTSESDEEETKEEEGVEEKPNGDVDDDVMETNQDKEEVTEKEKQEEEEDKDQQQQESDSKPVEDGQPDQNSEEQNPATQDDTAKAVSDEPPKQEIEA